MKNRQETQTRECNRTKKTNKQLHAELEDQKC